MRAPAGKKALEKALDKALGMLAGGGQFGQGALERATGRHANRDESSSDVISISIKQHTRHMQEASSWITAVPHLSPRLFVGVVDAAGALLVQPPSLRILVLLPRPALPYFVTRTRATYRVNRSQNRGVSRQIWAESAAHHVLRALLGLGPQRRARAYAQVCAPSRTGAPAHAPGRSHGHRTTADQKQVRHDSQCRARYPTQPFLLLRLLLVEHAPAAHPILALVLPLLVLSAQGVRCDTGKLQPSSSSTSTRAGGAPLRLNIS
eukprot:COSAG01_NODE_1536_length_9988_cov_5.096673_6_plen_264_part_00